MKKESLLLMGSILVTLLLSLFVIRWFAPQLLGLRSDQILVRSSKRIPAFYSNAFRGLGAKDDVVDGILVPDPIVSVRPIPFYPESTGVGPHDLLGFRNHLIPTVADVVTIGDSQTYGNNALIDQNWPHLLQRRLADRKPVIYSMAAGGWGAVQYLEMSRYAMNFQPRVMLVAFYSGNDSLESFKLAYSVDEWKFLQPDPKLGIGDEPKIEFPAPPSDWWPVKFPDGVQTVFTPKLRLGPNQPGNKAVQAGYQIMARTAQMITGGAQARNIVPVFTIIPTKEMVYAKKVEAAGLNPPEAYRQLIEAENSNIQALANAIKGNAGAIYVDMVAPLQQAALKQHAVLYPSDINGHPIAAGYAEIAAILEPEIRKNLPGRPKGLVSEQADKDHFALYVINHEGLWQVESEDLLDANGWKAGTVPTVTARDIVDIPRMGVLNSVDPARFGPASIK